MLAGFEDPVPTSWRMDRSLASLLVVAAGQDLTHAPLPNWALASSQPGDRSPGHILRVGMLLFL